MPALAPRWPGARGLYDIAQLFASAADPDPRVRRALQLLGDLVPYDRCALLREERGGERRLELVPPATAAEEAALRVRLEQTLAWLGEPAEAGAATSGREAPPGGAHLAVPLLDHDRVMGLLFVTRAGASYGDQDLCLLSVVASQVSSYLVMLQRDRSKDEFLATLSHELRTPLSAIMGWAGLLRAGRLDEAHRATAVGTILHNASALGRLVEDVIDVSRVATGKLRLSLAPGDPVAIAAAAVDAARPLAEARSIGLDLACAGQPGPILADAVRLEQVLGNLLGNALKFTPEGGLVEVRVTAGERHVRVSVHDTGRGLPAELLPRIFERFSQAEPQSRRGRDGLGLGLAIAHEIVTLHGGRIEASSGGEGAGAVFTVELPVMLM
jgi:signal transduction histidine kinase